MRCHADAAAMPRIRVIILCCPRDAARCYVAATPTPPFDFVFASHAAAEYYHYDDHDATLLPCFVTRRAICAMLAADAPLSRSALFCAQQRRAPAAPTDTLMLTPDYADTMPCFD